MKYYVSRTGTVRNLDAIRAAGFGLRVSRAGRWRREGFSDWVADNGAWADFQAQRPFDEDRFDVFLRWVATQPPPAWLVLPDVVAGGHASLRLSIRYLNRCLSVAPLVLIAVQDGMSQADLEPHVGPSVGIFMGGSDAWKLANMKTWGDFCPARRIHYHVGRVNTLERLGRAAWSRAKSADGSSAARFAETVPLLARGVSHARKYSEALRPAA